MSNQYPPQQPQYPPQQQQQYPPQQQQYSDYPPQQQYSQQPQPDAYQQQNYQQAPPNYGYQQQAYQDDRIVQKNPFLEADNSETLELVGFNERKGFIVKVYSLLSVQLFVTFMFCFIANLSSGYRDLLIDPNTYQARAFFWVSFVISLITEIAIFCFKKVAKKVPQNYIALTIFTLSFSQVVAGSCAVCYDYFSNGGILVVTAALLTLGVTMALTLYACTTKTDFTLAGGALWIIASVLLIVSIISIFYFNVILQLFICGLVIICYGFYLIYDTQLIVGGKTHQLSIDDFVIATMLIYIDIIILFLRILQVLMILFGKK